MKTRFWVTLSLFAAPLSAQVVLTPASPVVVRNAAGVTATPSPNGRVSISGLGISGTVELAAPIAPPGTVDSSSNIQFPANVNFQIRQNWSAGSTSVSIERTATGRCSTNLDSRDCQFRSIEKESSGLAYIDADIQLVAPGSSSFPTVSVRFRWSTGGDCPSADRTVASSGGKDRATTPAPGCPTGTITAITPSVASNDPALPYANAGAGAIRAVITGTGLPQSGTVSLGPGITVQNAVFKSGTEIEVSLSGFANLPEGPRDVVVANAAGARITGAGLFFVSSLVLKNLEINQGVPTTCEYPRPCIAQHNTVIRARIECNGLKATGEPCEVGKENVTARLNVLRNRQTLVLSPYPPATPMRVLRPGGAPDNVRLQNARDSLNFSFTQGNIGLLPEGTYSFELEIDPRRPGRLPDSATSSGTLLSIKSSETRSLDFLKSNRPPNHLSGTAGVATGGIRIALMIDPADTSVITPADLLRWMDFVRAVYPASADSIYAEVVPTTIAWAGEEEQTLSNVSSGFKQTAFDGSPFTHLFYFTRSTNQPGLSQCGEGKGGAVNYWNCWDSGSVVQIGPARGENAMGSVAHEIGHHYYLGDSYSFQPDHNPFLPQQTADPLCVFLDDGCPVEPGNMDTILGTVSVQGRQGMDQTTWQGLQKRDFMGSAARSERWVNLFNWNYLYPRFNDPPTIQTGEAARETSVAEPVDLINVRGGISAAGVVEFAPAIRTRGVPPGPAPAEVEALAEYRIEIQDGSGQPLASAPYQPVFKMVHRATPLERAAINETLPFPAGAARIVLRKGEAVLGTRPISANAPSVQLIAPSPGTPLEGKVRIAWAGADLDGDRLTYTLLYSKNGGTGWIPLAVNLSSSDFELDTALIAGSRDGRLRVIANDGVHSSSSGSEGPYSVAPKRPSVTITAPTDGAGFEQGQRVTVATAYWDHQDGQEGGTVVIRSDRDGVLSRERMAVLDRLSVGRHRITAAVTNSYGLSAEAAITITVGGAPDGPRILSLVPPQGAPGTAILINGANFSATPAQNIVRFGGTQAVVTASSATRIETAVPRGLAAGAVPVTVTVGANSSAPADFTVLSETGGGSGPGSLTPIAPLIARGWPNERTFDNPPANAVDGNPSTFTWTTNPNNTQLPSYFGVDFGAAKTVSRIRIFKDNDGGGGTLSDAFKNLVIEYTTSSAATPLASRAWTRVTGLINGYQGAELLRAQAVNADGSVTRDAHNSATDGWASLVFTPVNATGIRIGFSNVTNPSFFNHYKVHEFEAYGPPAATGGAATLQFSLNGIDAGGRVNFLSVNVGRTATVALTARNPGTAAVTVNSVSSSNPVFDGTPRSFTVAPGGTAIFTVSFTPSAARAEQGTLTLNLAGGGTVVLNLSGSGMIPAGGGTFTATLAIDNGNFTLNAGITSGGTAYFVNRLTPTGYPATLRSVLVFFPRGELPVGTPVSILAAANLSGAGGPLLAGLNVQRTATTISAQGTFVEIPVAALTIASGDFVVGFSAPNPEDTFPAALERESGSKQRSYISTDGANFLLIDSTAIGGGSFGIRAKAEIGGGNGGGGASTAITPRGIAGWPNGRTSDNLPANAIDGNTSTFTWTTNPFNAAAPSYLGLDLGALVTGVNRIRLYKDPDGGGGTLADNSKNLTIEYTTSDASIPLSARTWTTVTGLVNGFGGAELLNATAVNPGGTVSGDVHDSRVSGWASLTFNAVNATGIRIGFTNPRPIPTLYNHYKVYEIQVLR